MVAKSMEFEFSKTGKENAMAGNWTRVDCLEGNHANHYTTIAEKFN